jgi:hypothetical protein
MLLMIRLGLSLLLLITISNAQNTCAVEGLARANSLDGIRATTGIVRNGSLSASMLLLQPVAADKPHPPVLFSYSEIKVADSRTELLGTAVQLAKAGAVVMLLERTFAWAPDSHPVDRDPRLLDCASEWFLSQKNLDLLHITYVGPKVRGETSKPRLPSGIAHLPHPRPGCLRVPLGATEDGNDTLAFTKPEVRDRLISGIEQHWLVVVDGQKPTSK